MKCPRKIQLPQCIATESGPSSEGASMQLVRALSLLCGAAGTLFTEFVQFKRRSQDVWIRARFAARLHQIQPILSH
jgi:hypothetical protein